MSRIYSYPFGKELKVTNETVNLTPYTFFKNGKIWERPSLEYFYQEVQKRTDKINILDIGAQTGLYTLFAKFLPNADFYSFEPYKPSFEQLNNNVKLNEITNVKTFNLAISDKKEIKTLKVPYNHKGLNTLGDNPVRFEKNSYENIVVETDTIDNLFFEKNIKIDFIKCDIEGWEYFMLQGAKKTINKWKPDLFLEFNPDNMTQCNIDPEQFNNYINNILNYKLIKVVDEERYYISK